VGLYDDYKPFRNYMRQFGVVPSLIDVWCYSRHIMEGKDLPADYAVGADARPNPLKGHLYAWDLDILAREIVLNGSSEGPGSLKRWSDLARAVNHIRRLEDTAFKSEAGDVLLELHRIVQRQFRWQREVGVNPIMRAFKVFGAETVEAIIVREFGMTARQFQQLGLAVTGSFYNKPGLSTNQDYYGALGIPRETSAKFLQRITCPLKDLKAEIAKGQSYDRDWVYAWNPLEATPLISFDSAFPDRVICPIPRYLLRRISGGLFYDLVRSPDFDNPFGNSFQAYVGEVIKTTCSPPRFKILSEEPYHIGAQKMHGVDWILSDTTAHLFIEAKTKRLTLNARTRLDAGAIDRDLTVMATAIAQHYRNILDALGGKTRWISDGLPVYPMVLTLDNWFLVSPKISEMLSERVRQSLAAQKIRAEVLNEMPYTIASAEELELASQVIAQVGIFSVMSKKTSPKQQQSALWPFVQVTFKEELGRVNPRLFGDEFLALAPKRPDV
jgi:hypothetical protein